MTLENNKEMILGKVKEIFNLMQKIEESNYYDKWGSTLDREVKSVAQALHDKARYLEYMYKEDYAD